MNEFMALATDEYDAKAGDFSPGDARPQERVPARARSAVPRPRPRLLRGRGEDALARPRPGARR
jgi:hypothetical protein